MAAGIDSNLGKEIATRLAQAPYGERGRVVADYQAALGWSLRKIYDVAAAHGFNAGRKPRCDKGTPKSIAPEMIEKMAAAIEHTRRKTGKVNMSTWNALLHMTDNDIISADTAPSESTVNRLMREMHISRADLARPEPTIEMQTLHPNHVHQIDASVCVMWDFKGKKRLVPRDMQTEFYKNKPGFWRQVKKVILRYICVDHTVGWFYPRYYYSRGEDFNNLFDFTVRAWGVKENPGIFPAHGVPRILMIDKGAANISQFYTNFLANLQVETYIHTPGKPWINGVVEAMHGYWERSFEGDLSFLTIEDLDILNARAFDKAAYINATRVHKRTRRTRFEGFSAITKEQLYILPPLEVCQKFCHTFAEGATVTKQNQIRYEGRRYKLGRTCRQGDRLYVRYNPKDYPAVEVNTAEDFSGDMIAATLINETEWGYGTTAPVVGQEFKSHKYDATRRYKEKLKDIDISDVVPRLQAPKIERTTWMPKAGQDIISADTPKEVPITAHEARKRLRGDLAVERFTTIQSQWLDQRLAEQITEEQYAAIRDEYRTRFYADTGAEKPARRLVSLKGR